MEIKNNIGIDYINLTLVSFSQVAFYPSFHFHRMVRAITNVTLNTCDKMSAKAQALGVLAMG